MEKMVCCDKQTVIIGLIGGYWKETRVRLGEMSRKSRVVLFTDASRIPMTRTSLSRLV